MSNGKRIFLIASFLILGTAGFGLWGFYSIDTANSEILTSAIRNATSVINKRPVALENILAASSSATITGSAMASSSPISTTTLFRNTVASSTTVEVASSSGPVNFAITFPKSGTEVYEGCTYKITFDSTSVLDKIEMALIDAGTLKASGPIASGVASTTNMDSSQEISWKVGNVWLGNYYLSVSRANGSDSKAKSSQFTISRMATDTNDKDRSDICEQSGGELR